MTKLLVVLSLLVSFESYAHVEPGNYKGLDQNGKECSFTIGDMYFESELKHPLTERLQVLNVLFTEKNATAEKFSLGHPPVVSVEAGLNRYNHDIFQQIIPNKTGAVSVTVVKGPEEDESGKPVAVIYIEDNYRKKEESKKLTCTL